MKPLDDLKSCLADAGTSTPTGLGGTKNVCILSYDIFGPVKNGGIGTAYFHAARFLAQEGHNVVICFVNQRASDTSSMEHWREYYRNLDIEFCFVCPHPVTGSPLDRVTAAPYAAYEWLKSREKPFDIVHVSEWHGLGYIALLAKSLGMFFENTHFVVKGSSPTLWSAEGNQQFLHQEIELGWCFAEKRSAELADTLVCGSAHLLQWMLDRGYKLSDRSFYWPNIFLPDFKPEETKAINVSKLVDEWVFFGRLEPRKGLLLFIDAVSELATNGKLPEKITFLGGESHRCDGKAIIAKASANWNSKLNVITDKNAQQALEYLAGPGRLAIVPALLENSPMAVYELIAAGLPFIAADTGGTGELVAKADRSRVLFEPDHQALARRLADTFDTPCRPAKPRVKHKEVLDVWARFHEQPAQVFENVSKRHQDKGTPQVSVCLIHEGNTNNLQQAIKSIKAQSYSNVEVILVQKSSGSKFTDSQLDDLSIQVEGFGWHAFQQKTHHTSAARNQAARLAKGKYLLFFDGNNVMYPDMVKRLVKAAEHSQSDCLTCSSTALTSEDSPKTANGGGLGRQNRFLGPSITWGIWRNVAGDATCLVKASAFKKIGGFNEQFRVGRDDLELFNKFAISGLSINYFPDAVYFNRQTSNSTKPLTHEDERSAFRAISPLLENAPNELRQFLLFRPNGDFSAKRNKKLSAKNSIKRFLKKLKRKLG